MSRTTFDSLIAPLIKRTIDLIEDLLAKTSIPMDTIDNILLVGGSSCIPLVKSMLSENMEQTRCCLRKSLCWLLQKVPQS